ncbi:MAG TPA: DUF1015 domain-containing protein [Acidimicrobiales bacterium]|jgi:uncharacterized protein (DUF1015 family)|nr:DUF1015 domain-containing protein [Acidimicrobiales bacterium]
MPRFEPFHGLRYDDEVAPPSEVIAPPYDVVDDVERRRLAERSPYNAIHIELPVGPPSEKYLNASKILRSWLNEGVLRRDDVPAFYAYRMRYTDETGTGRSTVGVIGALEMDVVGAGNVLPHERTMPKPKGDRLDLLRATGINTSPIWGLSLATGLGAIASSAMEEHVPLAATDDDGVVHELSPITDLATIEKITALVGSEPVVIADGHHRYETATFFRAETREHNGDVEGPHDLVMALIVELSSDELFVEPIHRLISGLPDGFDVAAAMSTYFTVEPGPADPAALIVAGRERGSLGLVTAEGNMLLRPLPAVEEAAAADLDSCRLDIALATFPVHELVYQHGARIAADAVKNKVSQAAVLLRPATVNQIAETAHSGVRMPPKTTFFSPKPRTGLVYREARTPST